MAISKAAYLLSAALLLLGVNAGTVSSQPHVTITAEQRDNYHSILFTFIQNDLPSMEGCHYNLFAAEDPKKLRTLPGGGRSIATFYKPLPFIQIIATPLPHLARKLGQRKPKIQSSAMVYFRVLLSCPTAERRSLGKIITLKVKTFRDGTQISVHRLTHDMKYNMQYYNG